MARQLQAGSVLRTSAGDSVQVTAVRKSMAVQLVYNLTIADIHTYYVATGSDQVLAHNANPGSCEINLKYKEGWTDEQRTAADVKVAHLNSQELVVTESKRKATSASSRYRSAGNTVPSGHDVDHMHDLQLGGLDEVSNMSPLDLSVNRSLGPQIQGQIKNLPVGTKVGPINIS